MSLLDTLDKAELKELLVKCWMAHDGAWFFHCFQQFGIDAANALNRAAIRTLAQYESRQIQKALGWENAQIESFEDLKAFFRAGFDVVKGNFMQFEYSFPAENVLHWEMGRCFALEGMDRIGAAEGYQCGVLFRVQCWLEALGVNYTLEPPVERCLMLTEGKCAGDFTFQF